MIELKDIEQVGYWKLTTEQMIESNPDGELKFSYKESLEKAEQRYAQSLEQACRNFQGELRDIRAIIKASKK